MTAEKVAAKPDQVYIFIFSPPEKSSMKVLDVSRDNLTSGQFDTGQFGTGQFDTADNLTPAGFPIAHLKAFAPKFSGNISKMSVLLKLGVPPPSKVG